MTVTITTEQRKALYTLILDQLGGFDDLRLALDRGDLESAYRLGRAFSDGLRLIQEELGWGEELKGPFELRNIPIEDLRGILWRIRAEAIAQYEIERPEQEEFRAQWDQVGLIRDTCEEVLPKLKPQTPLESERAG